MSTQKSAYFVFKDNSSNQSISLVGLFALAFQRLLPSAQIVYLSWIGVRGHYSAIKNILEIIDSKENKEIPNKNKKFQIIFKKKIVLKNIFYKYFYYFKKVSRSMFKIKY